jgi:hypothetical protein
MFISEYKGLNDDYKDNNILKGKLLYITIYYNLKKVLIIKTNIITYYKDCPVFISLLLFI